MLIFVHTSYINAEYIKTTAPVREPCTRLSIINYWPYIFVWRFYVFNKCAWAWFIQYLYYICV